MSKSYFQISKLQSSFYKYFSFPPKGKKDCKDSIIAEKRETFPTNKPFI